MGGTTLSEAGPTAAEATTDPAPQPAEPANAEAPEALSGPRPPRAPLLVLLALVLPAALGQTAVVPALPALTAELPGHPTAFWVVTTHLLATAVGLPLGGKLGDLLGRKAALLLALLLLTAGAGLAGATHAPPQLLAFRALQGLGAGGLLSGVHAILAEATPHAGRGRRRRTAAAVSYAVALLAGPLAGGYCADHGAWRWSLTLNVPLGLLLLPVAAAALRVPRPAGRRPRPDLVGALLLAALVICLSLLASWSGTRYPWDAPLTLGLGGGALAAAALFPVVERLVTAPLIPPRLLREVLFGRTGLVAAALGIALYGALRHLPAVLPPAGGPTATASALAMLPLPGALLLAWFTADRIIRRTGHVMAFPILGCTAAAAGSWLLGHPRPGASRMVLGLWAGILGFGLGLVLPVLVRAVRAQVSAPDPAGALACLRRLGGGIGAALAVALLVDRLAARLPLPGRLVDPHLPDALPAALRDGYGALTAYAAAVPGSLLFLAPALVLGILLALFRKENPLVSHAPQTSPTTYPPYGDPADPAAVPPARSAADSPVNPAANGDGYPTGRPAYAGVPAPAAAGVPVCGTVQHHDGSIVPRAALTLIDVAGRQVGRGATGEDGRYALSTPGAGAYVLIAAAGGHQPQAVTVTVGERPVELDVVLGGAGRLAGTITTADGTPVRDAMVTLTDVRGEVVATTRSGREGGYVIGELVAGEYTLASSAPAFRPAALPVTVQASRETRQDVELAGGAVLRGTVRAGDGRPVEDARVTLLDAAGNVVDTATTGADGLFRFVDLSAGEYTVIAAGYPPVATVLRVAGGGRTERDLQLGHED